MGTVKRLNNTPGPWDNFPNFDANLSEENKFTRRFALAYAAKQKRQGTGIREFRVAGLGIADFIWIHHHKGMKQPAPPIITAFEIKLKDWKTGLRQAYRYSFFSNFSYLVVPEELSAAVTANISVFQEMEIGAIAFSKNSEIKLLYKQGTTTPKSITAQERALKTLHSDFNLSFLKK